MEEEEVQAITGPFSIAAAGKSKKLSAWRQQDPTNLFPAETDQIFPKEKRRATEDILFEKDFPWQITLYSDVVHGFSVRGELSEPRVKWAKEQAFFQAIAWFDEYVKKE